MSNHSAGVWVSDQDAGTQTHVLMNEIAFNGSGIATALGAEIRVEGNDFTRQFQQFPVWRPDATVAVPGA